MKRYAKAHIACGLVLSMILVARVPTVWSQAPRIMPEEITGIPFLQPQPSYNRKEIRELLINYIKTRLERLDNWPSDYASLPREKAVAIRYSGMQDDVFLPYQERPDYIRPKIDYWGGSWENASLDEAIAGAKKECGEKCIEFFEGDNVVALDDLVTDYITRRNQEIQSQKKEFRNAQLIVLISRPNSRMLSQGNSRRTQIPVPFPLEETLHVGYPDSARDNLSWCSHRVFYGLAPVFDPSQKASDLRALMFMERNGLYGFYKRSSKSARDFRSSQSGRMMDRMARFTRAFHFDADPIEDQRIVLPNNLSDALNGQKIRRLWIEGSVRVSSKAVPLVVDMEVSPLAVETDRNFYLGVEIHMPDNGATCSYF